MTTKLRLILSQAQAAIELIPGWPNHRRDWLQVSIDSLRMALGEANRTARHLRGSIMRALNFARAALRACA